MRKQVEETRFQNEGERKGGRGGGGLDESLSLSLFMRVLEDKY